MAKGSNNAPVVWRDGVHIVGTHIWCDARRVREVCFLSHAHPMHGRRHKQVIATDLTWKLMQSEGLRFRGKAGAVPKTALTSPVGRPFSMGDLRLELFSTGHVAGSAGCLVDLGSHKVAYTGPIAGARNPFADELEARRCDVLVMDATFGAENFSFPDKATVMAKLKKWVDDQIERGMTPVLLTDPVSQAPELCAQFSKYELRVHRSVHSVLEALREGRVPKIPKAKILAGKPKSGTVVVWPIAARRARGISSVPNARFALVSGWALDRNTVTTLGMDAEFPLNDRAGHKELLSFAKQTKAKQVYLFGGGKDLVAKLKKMDVASYVLAPPQQLALF